MAMRLFSCKCRCPHNINAMSNKIYDIINVGRKKLSKKGLIVIASFFVFLMVVSATSAADNATLEDAIAEAYPSYSVRRAFTISVTSPLND